MLENAKPYCPECELGELEPVDRRDFMRTVGGTAAASLLAGGTIAPVLQAQAPNAPAQRQPRPAEALIQELYAGLTEEQKRQAVYPWDHGGGQNAVPMRLRMVNAAFAGRIGQVYTRPQIELVERILRSISSGDDGYRQLARGGTFDGSGSLQGCGAYIFGDPTGGRQFSWVFQGHHLTVRCDGNSEPNAAFGGPMYYGHSPYGYSERNIFYYQTRRVMDVFDSLTENQRRQAIVTGNSGEHEASVRFREQHPGLPSSELTADQRRLVESVMRTILSPYRREDGDEVMEIVRRNGGLERIHLAFYRGQGAADNNWTFWRLEGPGFVWNFRVLPHVHTYVNIAARA